MKIEWSVLLIILLSIAMTGIVYGLLPDRIPMHWNVKGEVDRYGARSSVWITGFLPLVLLGLMYLLPRIDPRRDSYQKHRRAYRITVLAIILFLVGIHWIAILYTLGWPLNVGRLLKIGLGLLFLVIGNVLPQMRRNYTLGIRLPWTLASDTVWRQTHRIGGWCFVALGLLFIALSLLDWTLGFWLPLGALFLTLFGLGFYAYLLFRQEQRKAGGR